MTQIEKIKAEIERLRKHYENSVREFDREGYTSNVFAEQSRIKTCDQLLNFISSLPAEPVSEDLELASERYACKFSSSKYGHNKVKDAVVWGANWQEEQMLKDAKYVEVFDDWKYGKDADFTAQPAIKLRDSSLEIGKQVKLIIIKED